MATPDYGLIRHNLKGLFHAILRDNRSEVLRRAPGLIQWQDEDGDSAFIYAVRIGRFEIARDLLGLGSDINAQTKWGDTALMLAALQKNGDMVRFLLDHGADLDLKEDHDETALQIAEKFSTAIAQMLRDEPQRRKEAMERASSPALQRNMPLPKPLGGR